MIVGLIHPSRSLGAGFFMAMARSFPPIEAALSSLLFLLVLLSPSPAFSWFDKGHRVVGLIAQAHLTAEARKEIEKILPPGMTLADAAVWPDHEGRSIRDFDPLHYVNIPESAAGYDQARDCPERNCMVEAAKWFLSAVADQAAPMTARRMALYYLAHLIGDMHQPLHAGRVADLGGTRISVAYRGETTSLHFFWDKNLVGMESGSEEEIAKRLTANVSERDRLQWQSGDPVQWTNESLKLAHSRAYDTGGSTELSDDYVAKARSVVRARLAQAGIRLAWLLNRAFSKR